MSINNNNIETKDNLDRNEHSESLFWKVFHNKYLRSVIIQQIEELPVVGCGEKKKFKDIKSLEWLIDNQQLPLLKCKLEAGEDIEITEWGLSRLFKYIFETKNENLKDDNYGFDYDKDLFEEQYNGDDEYREYCFYEKNYLIDNKYYNENYENFQDITKYFQNKEEYKKGIEFKEDNEFIRECDKKLIITKRIYDWNHSISIESFKLLSKYKFNELMNFKLIDLLLEDLESDNKNKLLLKQFENERIVNQLLFQEPYCNSIIIDEDTIILAVKYSSPALVNKLFKNLSNRNIDYKTTIITDEFRNKSINCAINESNPFKDEMLEFILNDESLYNIPSISNKRLKLSSSSSSSIIKADDNSNIERIELFYLFTIKSLQIQNKLIKLNYIRVDQFSNEINENIINVLNNGNYDDDDDDYDSSSSTSIKERIIETLKILKIVQPKQLTKKCYGNYLLSNYEPIDGLNDELNFEISNQCLEFIKVYTTNYHCFKGIEKFDQQLLNFIFSINSNQDYELLLKSIIETGFKNDKLTRCIPDKWCKFPIGVKEELKRLLYPNRFIIQDTDTIDCIAGNFSYFKLFVINIVKNKSWYHYRGMKGFNFNFNFKTYQLVDYAKAKYGLNSNFFNHNIKGINDNLNMYSNSFFDSKNDHYLVDEIKSPFYIHPFIIAINNCDIESVKYIDQLLSKHATTIKFGKNINYYPVGNIKYSNFVRSKIYELNIIKKDNADKVLFNFNNNNNFNFYNNNQTSTSITSSNIIKLLDYFNSTGFKLFSNELFKKFIRDLSKLPIQSNIEIKISDLNINFQSFERESLELILESITNNISPNVIEIVLNNFNPFTNISSSSSIIDQIMNTWRNTTIDLNDTSYYKINGSDDDDGYFDSRFYNFSIRCIYFFSVQFGIPICCYSYESSNDIISSIKLLLNHLPQQQEEQEEQEEEQQQQSTSTISKSYYYIQEIINHLFKRLIKVRNVKIYKILQIYEHTKSRWFSITNNEFIFEHSQYHVFFYLGIKSKELMKYLMRSCNLIDDEDDTIEYFSVGTKSQKLLDPTIFTYDYIFNTPFDQLFESLKLNTTSLQINNDGDTNFDSDEDDSYEY